MWKTHNNGLNINCNRNIHPFSYSTNIDIEKKILKYQYITIFKNYSEKLIDLRNTEIVFKQNQKTKTLKIYKNKKCCFTEKEDNSNFNRAILEEIYLKIKA